MDQATAVFDPKGFLRHVDFGHVEFQPFPK
jgi:hypothetical protein